MYARSTDNLYFSFDGMFVVTYNNPTNKSASVIDENWHLAVVLISISLIMNEVEHLSQV